MDLRVLIDRLFDSPQQAACFQHLQVFVQVGISHSDSSSGIFVDQFRVFAANKSSSNNARSINPCSTRYCANAPSVTRFDSSPYGQKSRPITSQVSSTAFNIHGNMTLRASVSYSSRSAHALAWTNALKRLGATHGF